MFCYQFVRFIESLRLEKNLEIIKSICKLIFIHQFIKPNCTLPGLSPQFFFACRCIGYFGLSSKKSTWGETCLNVKGGECGQWCQG